MTDPILDDNLRRLLNAAPERARLSPDARRRIRTELGTAWEGAQVQPRPVPWPRMVAAAAALLLVALGATKLLQLDSRSGAGSPSGPSAGSSLGGDSEVAAATQPGRGVEGGAELRGPEGEEPGRVAAMNPGYSASSGGPEDEGVRATGVLDSQRARTDVRARLQVAAPGSIESLPLELTLWVKPAVQLPQVADPVAHELSIQWTPSPGEPSDRLAADFVVEAALGPAQAMGSDKVLLQVEMTGMAPARALVPLAEAAKGALRFELKPGIALSGTVVAAADGLPVEGALVVALDQLPLDTLDVGADPDQARLPQPYTATDSLGRFTLPHVAPEKTVRLRASGGGFAPTILSVRTAAAESTRIELGPGTTVRGVVERPDGSRWSGAVVVVSLSGRDPSAQDRPAMTYGIDQCDANGEYRVQGLPAGSFVALVFDPMDRETPREFRQLRIRDARELRVDFLSPGSPSTVETGLTLEGLIVDKDGLPLADESLSLSSLDGSITEFSEWRVAATDDSGRFSFQGIDASRYLIQRSRNGFELMSPIWEGRVEASETLRIALEDTHVGLSWKGALEEGRSWTILQRWRPDDAEWGYAGSAPSSRGRGLRQTEFDHLPPGRYRAALVGEDHGTTWTDAFEVEARRPVAASIQLKPGAALGMRLTGAVSGLPIAGATVQILDTEGRIIPQKETLSTDAEGYARQSSVPFERVTLVVRTAKSQAGAPVEMKVELDFTAAQPGPVPIQLPGI